MSSKIIERYVYLKWNFIKSYQILIIYYQTYSTETKYVKIRHKEMSSDIIVIKIEHDFKKNKDDVIRYAYYISSFVFAGLPLDSYIILQVADVYLAIAADFRFSVIFDVLNLSFRQAGKHPLSVIHVSNNSGDCIKNGRL